MADFSIYEELMPKIQALISPPDNINAGTSRDKSASDIHQFFKRRGKRHNCDHCDACGEKGNDLLCSSCPASFHLLCHDPPLSGKEDLNVPWTCNACQYAQKSHQQTSIKKPVQRRLESRHSSKESFETSSIINSPEKNLKKTATNPIPSASSDTQSSAMNNSLSVLLHDSIVIKNESIEEENVGSELEESSDEAITIENISIKTECKDEDPLSRSSLEFSLKTEPETDCHDSATGGGIGNVDGLNMDDVWKILGIDNRVKINTVKEPNRKASVDNGTNVSKISSDHIEMANFIETIKRNQVHINLTNCDYMLKNRKSSSVIIDSADEAENKKLPASKSKQRRGQTKISAVDNVTGIERIFSDIIKDASKVNPKQFTLPLEYIANVDMNLLGTEKDSDSFPNDLDSRDLLKLPARKCYYCKGTCLVGPMISCDFCPAHFHLNCLNPPLCNIPDVKWMCPLHPHHVLERVMKNPSSVTELMSWWSKFSVPIDDEDIKSNFIEKIKSLDKRPTNRKLIRSTVKIPDIVKYHYKHPSPRIPCLEQLVRSKSTSVFNNNFTSSRHDTMERTGKRCFNMQEPVSNTTTPRPELQIRKTSEPSQQSTTISQTNSNNQKKYNLRPFKKAKWKIMLEMNSDQCSRSIKSSDKAKISETDSNQISTDTVSADELVINHNVICPNGNVSEKECKPTDHNESNLSWKKIENFIIRDINRNFITGGISITTLSEDIRHILMIQRIKQLTEDLPPSFTPNANPYPLFHPLLKNNIRDTLPDPPKGRVRAVLCPLSHRPLIYMYGQSLSIGLGFSNNICLRNYGNCNFISEEHAVIFYDNVTNTYELINYSEYNTIVDGVCYTCDISRNISEKSANQITNLDKPAAPKSATKSQRKKSTSGSASASCSVQSKKTGSTVVAAETRSTYKKLLNDIDKLVSKSQQEMAAIADEDLNEISKAIKSTPAVIKTNQDAPTGKKRVQRVKRASAKRKANEINNDPKPSKIPRKSKPVSKQLAAPTDDATNSNCTQKLSKTGSLQARKLTISRRRSQAPARYRTRVRHLKKSKKIKSPNNDVTANDISCPSNQQTDCSDDEYLLGDNFFVNPKRSQCRCQSNLQKFPNGRDSSWERTAPLNHGSYIQFGCIEFIFSIVNYPAPTENRPYTASKQNSLPVRLPEPEQSLQIAHGTENKKDDLTIKLMSILNLLSSEPSQKTSECLASQQSSGPSSLSSRSASPILQNGHTSDRSESPRTPEHAEGPIEITG